MPCLTLLWQRGRRIARKVQPRTSRRLAKYSVGAEAEQARNLILEGENLQAMVSMYRERNQIDLIVTDPPYNTGKDFRYNDRWEQDPNDPDLGDVVGTDDSGRHTKWMKFMWPRLSVMKSMLKPGGVLAICIDEREMFRLGQMLDELFDEKNRLAIINWQKAYSPRNDKEHVSAATEYVLVYAKDKDKARTALLDRTDAMDARYWNPDHDPNGPWKRNGDATAPSAKTHPGMVYGIQNPFSGTVEYPGGDRCWASERAKMKAWLEEWAGHPYQSRRLPDGTPTSALVLKGVPIPAPPDHPLLQRAREHALHVRDTGPWPTLWFANDGVGRPNIKRYLERVKKGMVPMTYWADDDYEMPEELGSVSWEHEESGHSQDGVKELAAIVGRDHGFETVKPLLLFTKIIQLWCPPTGIVLDPFAGSGTTAHAVLALNHLTGSSRRFLLVEQGRPDRGDSYARSLTANRISRVVSGDWANGKGRPLEGGFRFCQLQKKVDAKVLLEMERDEMTDAVIASHYDANRRGGPGLVMMTTEGYEYLVAKNAVDEGFYLVWDGAPEPPVFNEAVYDTIVAEAKQASLKPIYHVYARFNLFQSDDVRFYQIPDQILLDFGLTASDRFNELDEQ